MDFQPTEDQRALRTGIRELLDGRLDRRRLLALADGKPFAPELWRELADVGVFSLRLPDEAGGAGLGMAEAALVFEELGRSLMPGPLAATFLASGVLPRAGTGDLVAGVVELPAAHTLVQHADALDVLFVLDETGVRRLDVKALEPGALAPVAEPLDPLTPLHRATGLPAGEDIGGPETARRWRREGAVLTAALQAGIALSTTELAVAYAKEREQFGRPIGSFQAVKHLCADMFARAELARVAVYAAAVTLDDPDVPPGDREPPVATAKVMADRAALDNARSCVQVHGGMGFTWEAGVHLFLKRASVLAASFGTAAVHEEALAAALTLD
ncbi:acyl-CoA dehydrogenase family protein [Spirillospora sp. CA-128828]|uniref:acyl-CoA dehydrogenase family protein n=1 Tax=Spirillospora sp. CA-128828 TaxID=3240033 RepID=UPI003D9346C6